MLVILTAVMFKGKLLTNNDGCLSPHAANHVADALGEAVSYQ